MVDIVFLYLWKAFDCSTQTTYGKNYLLMVSQARQLATWLPELLGDRLQKVVLNQAMSEWTPVASGIPKGSILGPLLFLFHGNDFPDLV